MEITLDESTSPAQRFLTFSLKGAKSIPRILQKLEVLLKDC